MLTASGFGGSCQEGTNPKVACDSGGRELRLCDAYPIVIRDLDDVFDGGRLNAELMSAEFNNRFDVEVVRAEHLQKRTVPREVIEFGSRFA